MFVIVSGYQIIDRWPSGKVKKTVEAQEKVLEELGYRENKSDFASFMKSFAQATEEESEPGENDAEIENITFKIIRHQKKQHLYEMTPAENETQVCIAELKNLVNEEKEYQLYTKRLDLAGHEKITDADGLAIFRDRNIPDRFYYVKKGDGIIITGEGDEIAAYSYIIRLSGM